MFGYFKDFLYLCNVNERDERSARSELLSPQKTRGKQAENGDP